MKTQWGHRVVRGVSWLGEQVVLSVVLLLGAIEYAVVPARPRDGHHAKT